MLWRGVQRREQVVVAVHVAVHVLLPLFALLLLLEVRRRPVACGVEEHVVVGVGEHLALGLTQAGEGRVVATVGV